ARHADRHRGSAARTERCPDCREEARDRASRGNSTLIPSMTEQMPTDTPNRRPRIAVIAAAGSASRMWPASKTIPKELFPLGKVPAIAHVVWEMIDAGIDDIRIVIRKGEPPAIAELLDPKRGSPPDSVKSDPAVQRFEQMIASAAFTF